MNFNLPGSRSRNDPNRVAEIKQWTAELFRLRADTTVMVTELRCFEAGCPPLETVIAILAAPGEPQQHKIHKALADVTFADVRELATRFANTYFDCDKEERP